MYSKHFLIIILFVIVNVARSNSDMKKSWIPSGNRLPNFETNAPQFTPFRQHNIRRDDREQKTIDQNIENDDGVVDDGQHDHVEEEHEGEDFTEKLSPITDYVLDLYDKYRKSKHSSKIKAKDQKVNDDDDVVVEPEEEDIDVVTKNDASEVEVEEEVVEATEKPSKELNRKRKKVINYNVGPGVNVSLDLAKEVVKVRLDEESLKDVFTGRGRKKDLITKTMALFILPFLIQSSFVPFLLASVKLLLIKSVMVGKIAILLLLLATFRNKAQMQQMPYYLETSPHRRSESEYFGYQVDGKPMTFIT